MLTAVASSDSVIEPIAALPIAILESFTGGFFTENRVLEIYGYRFSG